MKTLSRVILLAWAFFAATIVQGYEETWVYAVQVTAKVQADPARIELAWSEDTHPVAGYTVYRKAPGESSWGKGIDLPGSATGYSDESVTIGTVYEYQIVKHANYPYNGPAYNGYGYIATTINAPLVDERGRVIVVVDASIAAALSSELGRLQADLIGDGWTVVRKDVARDEKPAAVRALIKAEYEADRERTKAVFLLGHIPVLRSGNLNVDGHQARPMPADVFYGDMDGEWTDENGDGIYDQNVLPSDVELQVGRVDFADMSGATVDYKFPGEVELLRRYLDKDHAYRHAKTRPTARALIANPIGDARGQAYAASAYRNFAPLVGPSNVLTIDALIDTPESERFVARIASNDYLWVYGCGSGGDFALNPLGAHGEFNGLWSQDFIEQKAKGTFYQFFGSWFVDWSKPDNLMRAALTAPEYGLAASWSGRPHHFFHHMGIGETLGYGMRVSQNNPGSLYQNQVQRQLRGIHIALMGDPTLRLHVVAPITDLTTASDGGAVQLAWKASPDAVLGYHVYRSINGGAFARVTDALLPETRFVDPSRPTGSVVYMVRAVALQVGPSGSYYNASEGVFTSGASAAASSDSAPSPTRGQAGDMLWMDDLLPSGAIPYASENDHWTWIASDPAPNSGKLAHRSDLSAGVHHHFFAFATQALVVGPGDTLFAYVYLDPANPPREVMLTWMAEDWEHRAYWGENLITEGSDATASRRAMGPLPPSGQWVRLEVPAAAMGLENRRVIGMGFMLFDGRATWDQAGTSRP